VAVATLSPKLYTLNLEIVGCPWGTVRKTAGQCSRVRQVLVNLGVDFLERDISMVWRCKSIHVETRVESTCFQRLTPGRPPH
jgi:hypothetical protein